MKDTFESKYGKHQPNRGFTGTVSGRNLYVLTRAILYLCLWNWEIFKIHSIKKDW